MSELEYKHILRSCGINADGWMCACKRCGKQFGSYKSANNSDCRDTAKMRIRDIEDLELQINDIQAENFKLKERLQVELRASNVLAHEKYPKTAYLKQSPKGGEK